MGSSSSSSAQDWLGFSLAHQVPHHDTSSLCLCEAVHTNHGRVEDDGGREADLTMLDVGPKLEDFLGGGMGRFSGGETAPEQEVGMYDSDLKSTDAGFLRGYGAAEHSSAAELERSSVLPQEAKKAAAPDTFGQRTSIYRGVTRHRWTGRYEAHLWDNSCRREGQSRKGRQEYLGGYDKEEKAARAYDVAALKYWGPTTTTNFPVSNYEKELEEMKNMTRQEFVASLRRKSSGFSSGASIYRGVTRHHQHGRWQARIGRVAGNKDLYLGTFTAAIEGESIVKSKFRKQAAVECCNPLMAAGDQTMNKAIIIYTGLELERATNNFSKNNLLAEGGNGQVYLGILLDETKVAIKRPSQGDEEENIDNYIKHLSHDFNIHVQIINHPSIVSLIGCGFIGDQFHIVYEFMPNGSLYQHLHDRHQYTYFPWLMRLAILRQTANVLSFLHNESDPRIIHADVKSENILLDEDFNVKLSDFGHSQIVLEAGVESQSISMVAEGTPHLIDPYWTTNGLLTYKTDVHGFGVLGVEMLTGKKTKELERGSNGAFLIDKEQIMKSTAIDPSLKVGPAEVAWKQMMALGSLAVDCLSEDINHRPCMKQVLDQIECIIKWG